MKHDQKAGCHYLYWGNHAADIGYDDLGFTSFMEQQFFSFPSPK